MQKINKNLRFSSCGNQVRIDCLHCVGGFTPRGKIFTIRGEKSFAVRELVQDTYRERSEAANPILFNFNIKIKILKF
jgi:hypothetical protein